MSVAVRVIPCLDVDAGRVVKGVNFKDLRDAGDPVEMATVYDAEGADELVFLDITASSGDRETTYDVVRRTAEQVFIPLTVGGGVRTVEDFDRLLRAGADKVGVNTAAIAAPRAAAPRRPTGSAPSASCCRSTRAAARTAPRPTSGFEVTTHGGRTRHRHRRRRVGAPRRRARRRRDPAQLDGRRRHEGRLRPRADPARARGRRRPADRQRRSGQGRATSRPAVDAGADAVLAASVFHFGDLRIGDVKDALRASGHAVR